MSPLSENRNQLNKPTKEKFKRSLSQRKVN